MASPSNNEEIARRLSDALFGDTSNYPQNPNYPTPTYPNFPPPNYPQNPQNPNFPPSYLLMMMMMMMMMIVSCQLTQMNYKAILHYRGRRKESTF